MPEFELELDRVATGGAGLGNGPDGRVVFATGGLPGERVRVAVETEHRTRLEAVVTEVVRPAPGRVEPSCPHVAEGCGGCDWQHATPELQRELRRAVVLDCLRRLAKLDDVEVRLGPVLEPVGYRTTVRASVSDGRAGYRAARSHRTVPVDSCLVTHPMIEELLVDGYFGSATEVTVRVGAATGERLVLVSPNTTGVKVPDDVIVIGQDEIAAGSTAHYHEEIKGRRLRISAPSFFQCRADGAEALIELVLDTIAGAEGPVLDAYCGVGLFGAMIDTAGVVGVESNRWSAGDAAHNVGPNGSIVRCRMERWRPEPMGAVIADPARTGLGSKAADKLVATKAPIIALVSCDPASLARDAALLRDRGYRLDHVTVLDMFAQTSHIEAVSRFVRENGS